MSSAYPAAPTYSGAHATASKPAVKPKPTNVFSNDGSFLERFQRHKTGPDDKQKTDDDLKKKREFDQRFKNRRKRVAPEPDEAPRSATPESQPPAKKAKASSDKTEAEKASAYSAQVKGYASRSLQEQNTHIGSRSLVR
ncbi:hypothetical protein BKA62DRAFT_510459 [Auriculariales sp. MPI-PUGE-AT-0066]|nr:hypothetical protein BKA62DRAFT_510459 [Auriculariales sp. MPI-PUGE-AT-0066]